MKKNLTEMVFILDRSGSMGRLVSDTIGGFNSMIDAQKQEEGSARITTVLFDNEYEILHDNIDIAEIPQMTDEDYFARGTTALLDALGRTINDVGMRLAKTSEEERPENVILVITTDGFENASKEFARQQVKGMIEHQQAKYNWTFMFLGANMDAVSEAGSLGICTDFARTYTASSIGTQSVYTSLSKGVSTLRSCGDVNDEKIRTAVMDSLDGVV